MKIDLVIVTDGGDDIFVIYGHPTTYQGEWNGEKLPLKFSHEMKKESFQSSTKIFYSNDTMKGSPGSPVLAVAKTKDGDTTLSVIGI